MSTKFPLPLAVMPFHLACGPVVQLSNGWILVHQRHKGKFIFLVLELDSIPHFERRDVCKCSDSMRQAHKSKSEAKFDTISSPFCPSDAYLPFLADLWVKRQIRNECPNRTVPQRETFINVAWGQGMDEAIGEKERSMDASELVKRKQFGGRTGRRRKTGRSSGLLDGEVERLNERGRQPMKKDLNGWGGGRTRIAGETLFPGEPPMSTRCAGFE